MGALLVAIFSVGWLTRPEEPARLAAAGPSGGPLIEPIAGEAAAATAMKTAVAPASPPAMTSPVAAAAPSPAPAQPLAWQAPAGVMMARAEERRPNPPAAGPRLVRRRVAATPVRTPEEVLAEAAVASSGDVPAPVPAEKLAGTVVAGGSGRAPALDTQNPYGP
jgi:hypothetical protein